MTDARGRLPLRLADGHLRRGVSTSGGNARERLSHAPAASAAPHVASRRPAGRRRVRGSSTGWPRRAVVVADAAARPARPHGSPYKARSAFAAWPGLLAAPGAPVSAREPTSASARPTGSSDWERSAARRLADQVRFDREWARAARATRAERGVRLIGDVPIYVAPGSRRPPRAPGAVPDDVVAGVPPDAFTAKGQLWGNPLYDWPALRRRGYRWWVERLRRTFALFDLARIDHFRGFVAYWAVPAGARDARAGAGGAGRGARCSTPPPRSSARCR